MRRLALFAIAASALALLACEAESTTPNRGSVGASDAGADADALAPGQPDPKDGRDEDPASCYAACSNTAFSCQAGNVATNADLIPDSTGCAGTLTTGKGTADEKAVALKLDCGAKKICIGTAPGQPADNCVAGSFSAFSFSYTPAAGGAQNVCIRD